MKTVTYKCDRCGREWTAGSKNAPQLWSVGLRYGPGESISLSYPGTAYKDQHWCRSCMEQVGIFMPDPQESAPTVPPPTFEDIVREMITEEVANQLPG